MFLKFTYFRIAFSRKVVPGSVIMCKIILCIILKWITQNHFHNWNRTISIYKQFYVFTMVQYTRGCGINHELWSTTSNIVSLYQLCEDAHWTESNAGLRVLNISKCQQIENLAIHEEYFGSNNLMHTYTSTYHVWWLLKKLTYRYYFKIWWW
jgi:hypothetical protein